MNAPRLSAITIAKNEERHIGCALQSVRRLADEIVVVESESNDRTAEIAREFTDKVFSQPWRGYGPQKNFAREQAAGEWIFHLDADEEVPPELATEIRDTIAETRQDFLWLPIVTWFLGRPLVHMRGTNLRLFRRAAGRWDDKIVHEQVERVQNGRTVRLGDVDTVLLRAPLLHHSHYQTLAEYRERQERYSSADAEQMLATGKDRLGKSVVVNPRNPLSVLKFLTERAAKQFIRKFLRQRGFLDGWQGWVWCAVSAEYEYKMCRKYLALRKQEVTR